MPPSMPTEQVVGPEQVQVAVPEQVQGAHVCVAGDTPGVVMKPLATVTRCATRRAGEGTGARWVRRAKQRHSGCRCHGQSVS